MEVIQ
jgi:hypothetical protein